MPPIDFNAIAADLLGQARSLLPQWFPAGKFRGREFLVGNLAGDEGDSLSINADTGCWADFASGEKGGDLIALYAAMKGVGQAEAAKELSGHATTTAATKRPKASKAEEPTVGMPPADAPPPDFKHYKHGPAVAHWTYRDANGHLIGYISRHQPKDGSRKQIIPWGWDTQRGKWRNLSFAKPRPLYGLDLLAASPDAPVLLVEGEKAADAARQIVGTRYVVVTWPGGAKALRQADWTPLHGRRLLLWPDADRHSYPTGHAKAGQEIPYTEQPGHLAMVEIAGLLSPHCPEVKIIDVQGVEADGWDAADALAEGWGWKALLEWAKPRARECGATPEPEPEPDPKDDGEPAADEGRDRGRVTTWLNLGLALNSNGAPYANLHNVKRLMLSHPNLKDLVWYDEFAGRVMIERSGEHPREWKDEDARDVCDFIQGKAVAIDRMTVGTVHDGVDTAARTRKRNPPRDWMNSLKWDGDPRLASLTVQGFGADESEYSMRVGECWMISMVARVMHPGCKVDTMPIFEGEQGAKKSQALEVLGGDWYINTDAPIGSREFLMNTARYFLVELGELSSSSRADVERVKSALSTRFDVYRSPYDRLPKEHRRKFVCAGTTNRDDWNLDDTGARRFWPIRCSQVDLDWIRENRDQLFAEAVARYKAGEPWWTVPKDEADRQQQARRQQDPWEEPIAEWLDTLMFYGVTTKEIFESALKIEYARQDLKSSRRVGIVMRSLGWKAQAIQRGGRVVKGWVPKDHQS